MFNLQRRVEITNETQASAVENLRVASYLSSKSFKVIDEDEVKSYCKWNEKDAQGLVLIALNEHNEVISTLRANIYFEETELIKNNPIFKQATDNFVEYPVLDLTIAATNPAYFQSGILSALRYYMYILHRHTVKTITGVAVKNSSIYKSLSNFGYEFIDVDTVGKDVVPSDCWTIAKLSSVKFDNAINLIRSKYNKTIMNYPLIIK